MGDIITAIIMENEGGLSLNDLNLIQRLTLKRAYTKGFDPDEVSDKEAGVLDSLVDLGLLDWTYDVTPDGARAAELLDKYSKRERADLQAAKQLAAETKPDMPEDDYVDDDFPFTEGEKDAIKKAGLDMDEIAKIFEALSPVMQAKEAMFTVADRTGFEIRWNESETGQIESVEVFQKSFRSDGLENHQTFYLENFENLVDMYNDITDYMADPTGNEEDYYDEPEDQFRDDVEADADALASAGWGTDEDYGDYGDDGGWY
jgi:hypothetical protein